jgi:hypothetical protein
MEGVTRQRVVALAAALLAGAGGASCGGGEPTDPPPPPDPSDQLFDPARVIDVVITMAPEDWNALRVETRTIEDIFFGADCLDAPFPDPFDYFHADVTVDGETAPDVGIRKKGFLGSLDEDKPSLKLKLDEYVDGGTLFGLERITLNNSKQDASYVHQCLAYELFADAGLPAPRCNFARVIVNGEDLGLYVNVESVDKRFLRRWFADAEGDLWEGTLSDFTPEWDGTFEKKTNETNTDRSAIDAVIAAAMVPDAELEAALGAVIDLDEFVRFWAVEVLLQHWDGYAGNENNFFVYGEPGSGVFTFLPWGADQVFAPSTPAGPGEPLRSIYATGALAWRLYRNPATQPLYAGAMNALLAGPWDEDALLAEIDRMEALITPVADPEGTAGLAASIEDVRTFVSTRRGILLDEWAGGAPAWDAPQRAPICFNVVGDAAATFDTTFGTIGGPDPFAGGTGTLTGTVMGTAIATTMVGAAAGFDPNAPANPTAQVQVVALLADGTVDVAVMGVTPALFVTGAMLPVDWMNVTGGIFNFDPATGAGVLLGYFLDGQITLDDASTTDGAPVRGSMTGTLISF